MQSKAGELKTAIKAAIGCGYRLLDCAYGYGNEAEVGDALAEVCREGSVCRDDIFVISKVHDFVLFHIHYYFLLLSISVSLVIIFPFFVTCCKVFFSSVSNNMFVVNC